LDWAKAAPAANTRSAERIRRNGIFRFEPLNLQQWQFSLWSALNLWGRFLGRIVMVEVRGIVTLKTREGRKVSKMHIITPAPPPSLNSSPSLFTL
jgi:hypothetical protein